MSVGSTEVGSDSDDSGFSADVLLTWDLSVTPIEDVDGQRLYRSTVSDPVFPDDYSQIVDLGDSVTSYEDNDAPAGEELTYAITAFNEEGESEPTFTSIETTRQLNIATFDKDIAGFSVSRIRSILSIGRDTDSSLVGLGRDRDVFSEASDIDEFVTALNRLRSVQVTASDTGTSTYVVERERPLDILSLDEDIPGVVTERIREVISLGSDIDQSQSTLEPSREVDILSLDADRGLGLLLVF